MTDKIAEYEVTADPSKFTQGMEAAELAAQKAGKNIRSSIDTIQDATKQLSGTLSLLTGWIGKLTAVAAGGAAFKELISASNNWTGEAKKLSVQLGITTERASVMMVAMRHLGLDSDVVTLAATNMAKQIHKNGQAFDTLGVKVKDSAGEYRPVLDVMGEVNGKLKEIKNPIAQNIAGMQIYGKAWGEVRASMKLTSEEIKKAEQKTKDLGLVVGEEGVAQVRLYKESLADMKLVVTSLEVQAGGVLLPTFARLGGWLSGAGPSAGKVMGLTLTSLFNIIGTGGDVVNELWGMIRSGWGQIGDLTSAVFGTQAPDAMTTFENGLKVVEIAFLGLKVAVQLVILFVVAQIELCVANVLRFASVAERAFALDFSGAKKAWTTGTKIIEDIEQKHVDKLFKIASDGKAKLDDIALRAPARGPEIKDKQIHGGPSYEFAKEGKDEKDKGRTAEWEGKLEAEKEAYAKSQAIAGTAQEYSHAQEVAYWRKILATVGISKEEKLQVEKKYYAATAAVRKDDFENDIAAEKLSLEAYRHNYLARLDIANKIYTENVARFGAESKEAKAALAEVYKEQRAFADQSIATAKVVAEAQRNADLSEIDAAQQDAELKLSLHQITEEKLLDLEARFEAKRYQIKAQALKEAEALLHGSDQDPTALAQIHAQIEAAETAHQAKLTAIKSKATQLQSRAQLGAYASIESGFARVLSSTAQGTTKVSSLLQNMLQVVTGAVIDMLAQSAAKWLANLVLTQTTAKVAAISQISANAGVAGAAATASAAAIPVYGWAIAPEAGVAASGAALGFLSLASARGGYDIPANLNPIVQVHEQEMILPKKQAQVIRDMADGGGGGGHTINYHDHTGNLSPATIRRNVGLIAKALQDHAKKS
jgi:hypothetical protein